VITLTPKQNVAWLDHLDRPELRRAQARRSAGA